MTPARYIENVRSEAARDLLETGDEPLMVVARRAGFGSPESLRRTFARRYGVTPSAYRPRFRAITPARCGTART
jgi:transcriptional regulator GlxA family with amidase domain